MKTIPGTDLLINADGSVYHLKLHPDQLADTVIIVGDPGRVEEIVQFFDKIDSQTMNREFRSCTGWYGKKRITALSTGIGPDNIDIVLHELDALANIDFAKREVKQELTSLTVVRIGTSGAIRPEVPLDSIALSTYGMGLDNLLRFYDTRGICDLEMESQFIEQTGWKIEHVRPYFVKGSEILLKKFSDIEIQGITATAPGFYGPQGRRLRLQQADPGMIERLKEFGYRGEKIINFEMETSALYGLGALMGHQVITICALIANRATETFSKDHRPVMKTVIGMVLEKLRD